MPEGEVELVRRAIAALNARDAAAYLACCTRDVELYPISAAIEGAFEGEAGIRRFFDGLDAVPDLVLREQSIEVPAPGLVAARLRAEATGRASGVAADLEVTNVYELADGLIRRVRVFTDRDEAAAAVEAARR